MAVKIVLNLQGHCIETAARKRYKKLMDSLLMEEVLDERSAEEIRILLKFLQNYDFAALRASDERLSGVREAFASILEKDDGTILVEAFSTPR